MEGSAKKIIDCFIFYNEIDLLNYRLHLLYDVVDYFVIVESDYTFAGKQKTMFFDQHSPLFAFAKDKIVHIVVNDFPHKVPHINYAKNEQWVNEEYQRSSISVGLDRISHVLNADDIILITDVDEIPDPRTLQEIKNGSLLLEQNVVYSLEMDMYYYNLNCKYLSKWTKAKALRNDSFKSMKLSCAEIRMMRNNNNIKHGGWHLSYFGDSMYIKNKIENFSHQELNKSCFTDAKEIELKVNSCSDLYGRRTDLVHVAIEDNNYLPKFYEIYLHQFVKKP